MIRLSKWFLGGIGVLILILLLLFSAPISRSVAEGVSICLDILVPSLFVFLILSDLFVQTGILSHLLKPFGWICGKLFHLPTSLGAVLLMSLLCGYPVGARLIRNLVDQKQISPKMGTRLLCFCVNAGPAFLIGSVGIPIFGSLKLGVVLFCSHVTAFFVVGIISGFQKEEVDSFSVTVKSPSFSEALVTSVKSATNAMVNICAFVLLFSGILGLLRQIGFFHLLESISTSFLPIPSGTVSALVTGILEVSNGVVLCKQVPGAMSFFLTVVITAFGGLCVHMQIRAILSKTGVSMKPFYRYRILYIATSLVTSFILFQILEDSISVFSTNSAIIASVGQSNPYASILLLIFSVFLLCCDKKSATIEMKQIIRKGKISL